MNRIASNSWDDAPAGAQHGPGISRAANPAAARTFRLRVAPPRGAAMIVTLRAESKRLAVRYAANRWPEATITPLP
jgi:hypothetical protein